MFCRCSDSEKVERVNSTVASVERLTTEMHDTARFVANQAAQGGRSMEQNLVYMSVVEKMNLIQREWATKVRFATHDKFVRLLKGGKFAWRWNFVFCSRCSH